MFPVPVQHRLVPTISFESLAYAARMSKVATSGLNNMQNFRYVGPSQALKRIATAVGAQGAVLPINPPSANATWSSYFSGPALRCGPIPSAEQDAIYRNILEYTNDTSDNCFEAGGYYTWYANLPYDRAGGLSSPMGETDRSIALENATFHVAVLPALVSYLETAPVQPCGRPNISLASLPANLLDNSTLLQCQLVNTTYQADFKYTDGNQTVVVNAPPTSVDTRVERLVDVHGPSENENSCAELHGYSRRTNFSTQVFEPCRIEPEVLQRIAYQSMLEAFFGVISGPVNRLENDYKGNILSTTLLETLELDYLTDYAHVHALRASYDTNLHKVISDSGRADIAGLSKPDPTAERLSLADGLEQMFQNLTLSLMSSTVFQ